MNADKKLNTKSVDHAITHLNRLAKEIGGRVAGTAGCQQAEAYIRSVFTGCGLETETQAYAMPAWEHHETRLELDGVSLPAFANTFSPACRMHDITVPVCTLAELEQAHLEGRIAVLYGDLTSSVLSCKSWFLKSERDDAIIRLLEEKAPAALLTVQAKPGSRERLIEDWEFLIPSATVPAETGLKLLGAPGQPVSLTIRTSRQPGRAANVVARRAGRGAGRVVLCAHYDTKIDTPGATDNAGGVAVLLALAEMLGEAPLEYDLELIAFCNEEYLPIGDDAYIARLKSPLEQVVAAVNFDGVGQVLGATSIMLAEGSPALLAQSEACVQRYPGVVWVAPWPESNHSTFSFRGVPSFALSTCQAWQVAHQPLDTVAWVSPAKLGEAIALAADLVQMLQGHTCATTHPPAG